MVKFKLFFLEGEREEGKKLIVGASLRAVEKHMSHHCDEGDETHRTPSRKVAFNVVWTKNLK